MAGPPYSKPQAPPPPPPPPRYVITSDGWRTSVEVDGVPIRRLVDVNVRFGLHELPSLELTIGMPDVRVVLNDAAVSVDAVDLPDPVARALYQHLRNRFAGEAQQ